MAEMLKEEQLAVKCIVLINSCAERNYSVELFALVHMTAMSGDGR